MYGKPGAWSYVVYDILPDLRLKVRGLKHYNRVWIPKKFVPLKTEDEWNEEAQERENARYDLHFSNN